MSEPEHNDMEPRPGTTAWAFRRLGLAVAAFWWELIYATRLDKLAAWLEARIDRP